VPTAGGTPDSWILARAPENGVTQDEIFKAITHVTLYAGWPKGTSAVRVAKQLFTDNK
jgi:4-carboxymuconolactone decarboxylase